MENTSLLTAELCCGWRCCDSLNDGISSCTAAADGDIVAVVVFVTIVVVDVGEEDSAATVDFVGFVEVSVVTDTEFRG